MLVMNASARYDRKKRGDIGRLYVLDEVINARIAYYVAYINRSMGALCHECLLWTRSRLYAAHVSEYWLTVHDGVSICVLYAAKYSDCYHRCCYDLVHIVINNAANS